MKNFTEKLKGCKTEKEPIPRKSVSFVLKKIWKLFFYLVDTRVPVWIVPRLCLGRATPKEIVLCVEAKLRNLTKYSFEFHDYQVVKHNFWEFEVVKIDFVVLAIFVLMAPIVFQPMFPWSPR